MDKGYAIWQGVLIYITENGNAMGTTLFPQISRTKFIEDSEVEEYLKSGIELLSDNSTNLPERFYPTNLT